MILEFSEQRPSPFQSDELQSGNELLSGKKELEQLSIKHNIPEEDIVLIALNASGIKYGEIVNDRGRFVATFPDGRRYFLALTLSHKPLSPFEYQNGQVVFGGQPIAQASSIEKDTCTDSYWRGGKKHLTLNSNSRSNCRGCSFCGTYNLVSSDKALTQSDALRHKAEILCGDLGRSFSLLESVGVVTGCFPSERELVDHLMMVRKVFGEFGFGGEMRYVGSQLRSSEALQELIGSGPFAIYLTVEAFERRKNLMKGTKASLDLEKGRELLAKAKDLGAETCFLYIAGLDSYGAMEREFPLYVPSLTRLPQIQTFQIYNPEQIQFRHPEASHIEYFLKTRQLVEQTYPHLLPIAANNFRSLWYTKYGQQTLPNGEI